MTSPIRDVRATVLRVPVGDPADLDSSAETVLIEIEDSDGRIGIGEADAPAAVVKALVEMDDLFAWSRGLRGILLGRDPFCVPALHAALSAGTIYHGRRGLGVHALSGVDVALWDLAAKQTGRPVYEHLGGAVRDAITPYATVWPGAVGERSIGEMMDVIAGQFEQALALGFRAIKMEVIFEGLVDDRELVRCIVEGRRLVGDDVALGIDFGYRWHDWRRALRVLERIDDADILFAEACLQHDDREGHRKLAARSPVAVCAGEFAATLPECREWLEAGVDVVQPDVSRCGGLTELQRIAALAAQHGAIVVPHGWKTGITAAAARHFQAATPNAPYIEMFVPALWPSALRAELTRPEPEVVDGRVALPTAPGLGIEVVPEAVARYRA